MKRFWNCHRANLLMVLSALAVSAVAAGCASTAPPPTDESQLLGIGLKVLVATKTVQEDWAQSVLPPDRADAAQR